MRTDIHQHLWTEPLLEALERRFSAPRARFRSGTWFLDLPGEPPCAIHPEHNDPGERAALVRADRLDRALIAISSPLGAEALPAGEAAALVGAYHEGLVGLPEEFGAWGAVTLADPDPAQVDSALESGCVGLSIPAAALAEPYGWDRLATLIERLERRGAPLFVHPGPAPWRPAAVGESLPSWWPALTAYLADLNAAWLALAAHGRANHRDLRVVFAALAGGAPFHLERLAARGGPAAAAADPNTFFEVSGYGPRAIDAAIRAVGADQLVFGSDRPVADPPTLPAGDSLEEALTVRNPATLLAGSAVAA